MGKVLKKEIFMKKKFWCLFLSLAVSIVCLCSLVGCGGKAGVYKLDSITVDVLGTSKTIKTGEDYNGTTLSEDLFTIELKDDGSYTLTADKLFMLGSGSTGTWAENKDDSDKIDVTVGGVTTTYYCDGSEFRFDALLIKVVLKK